MFQEISATSELKVINKSHYSTLSLIELIKVVTENNCLHALKEFHNKRTVFSFNNSHPMLFIDYVKFLRHKTVINRQYLTNTLEVADKAYDLTIDKFLQFTNSKEETKQN